MVTSASMVTAAGGAAVTNSVTRIGCREVSNGAERCSATRSEVLDPVAETPDKWGLHGIADFRF